MNSCHSTLADLDVVCFFILTIFFYLFNGATREDGCLSLDYGSPTGTLYAPGRRFEAKIRKLRVFLAKARNKEITHDLGGGELNMVNKFGFTQEFDETVSDFKLQI